MLTLSQQDFMRLSQFVKANYGIDLSKKMQLITGRLSNTILSLGYSSFTDYIDHLITTRDDAGLEVMLNKLTTNYTYFMREETHFHYFQKTILPYLLETKKNKVLSIWSAGCSSGQEPYTISMIIKETLGLQAALWDTKVLATDISQNALRSAKEAIYHQDSLKDIPPAWKSKYFIKSPQAEMYTVAPAIKSNVIFQTFNLMSPIRFRIKFDVIFCRNVMIYFDQQTKDGLINRFYDATNAGGYLLIGHSETVNKDHTNYKYIMPATYRK